MASVYIATKKEFSADLLHNAGIKLFNHLDLISAIGEEFSLKRLDECVYTPTEQVAEFLRNAGATEEEIAESNPDMWFDSKEGLSLLKNYIEVISSYPALSETTKLEVIPELEQFCVFLKALLSEDNEWHFEYDI